jgi:hypothetical protein
MHPVSGFSNNGATHTDNVRPSQYANISAAPKKGSPIAKAIAASNQKPL